MGYCANGAAGGGTSIARVIWQNKLWAAQGLASFEFGSTLLATLVTFYAFYI